ncbi:MAG TPA: zinc-binding dehydrogenase [Thermoplasmata archaeon]|nr:zinc-binding dehydrogenase [Thermoplasmata archaeon]
MRGFGFREHGGPEVLEYVEVPEPVPGPGEIRVRIEAAGFNRLDLFTRDGIPGVPIERPHVLGSDGAGRVDRLGPGVDGPAPGTPILLNPGLWDGTCPACRAGQECLCRQYRIVGEHTQGTAAPFVVVPARNVHPRPASLDVVAAAAAPLVFQTAYRALRTVGELREGERCAIVGAGGGVATAAIQIARMVGARVAVATRSREKGERAAALGAEPVVFDEETPLDKALWTWSEKQGVDVVFDSIGAPTLARSVRALARGGRVVVIGATGGPKVEIDVRPLFWRQASVRGSTMASAREFDEVLAHLAAGRLRPIVDRSFPFEAGREALARMDAPDLFGKVVLRVGP